MDTKRITKIKIDGKIAIDNPPHQLVNQIKKKIRLKNPAYWPAVKKNPKAQYALNKFIEYFEYNDNQNTDKPPRLILPRGIEGRVKSYFDRADHPYEIKIKTSYYPIDQVTSSITLRDYQKGFLDPALPSADERKSQGVFRADTGAGKTIMSLELISKIKQRTLIVVPKLDILEQFQKQCREFLDIEPGTIQGDNHSIKDVTLATIQTLQNRLDKIPPHTFGLTIWDECHMYVPKKSRACVEHFDAHYRYGFTATAKRSDGQGQAIKWIFGDILADMKLPRKKPEVHVHEFDGHIWQQDYHLMVEQQVKNEDRNKLIANTIEKYAKDDHKILVLVKRLDHARRIKDLLPETLNVYQVDAQTSAEEREEIYEKFRRDDSDGRTQPHVLLGTFSLLSTGVDLPAADCALLAGALKSSVLSEQSIGRILRIFEGKRDPIVVDIHDSNNKIFHRHFNERKRLYKKKGWEIKHMN